MTTPNRTEKVVVQQQGKSLLTTCDTTLDHDETGVFTHTTVIPLSDGNSSDNTKIGFRLANYNHTIECVAVFARQIRVNVHPEGHFSLVSHINMIVDEVNKYLNKNQPLKV